MVYDVYKYLVENEETILKDLSMLKYIKADLDRCVFNYLETLIREHISSASAEEQMQVLQDIMILRFIDGVTLTLRSMLHGNTNTLH